MADAAASPWVARSGGGGAGAPVGAEMVLVDRSILSRSLVARQVCSLWRLTDLEKSARGWGRRQVFIQAGMAGARDRSRLRGLLIITGTES